MSANKNIFNLPLYYISFEEKREIEDHYRENGFKNVHHFPAVNGRKLNLEKLLRTNVISLRAYEDILNGREASKGLPSKGAIGCTLSHYELWKKAVKEKHSAVIIAEDDNRIVKIEPSDIQRIQDVLQKPNGLFISTRLKKLNGEVHFYGTHFYIASLGACERLIENALPIDVQTDWYLSYMARNEWINIDGYPISVQYNPGKSSTQTSCLKCGLPSNLWFYVGFLIFFCFLILSVVYLSIKLWKKHR